MSVSFGRGSRPAAAQTFERGLVRCPLHFSKNRLSLKAVLHCTDFRDPVQNKTDFKTAKNGQLHKPFTMALADRNLELFMFHQLDYSPVFTQCYNKQLRLCLHQYKYLCAYLYIYGIAPILPYVGQRKLCPYGIL